MALHNARRRTGAMPGAWGIFLFRRKCPLLPGSPGSALNLTMKQIKRPKTAKRSKRAELIRTKPNRSELSWTRQTDPQIWDNPWLWPMAMRAMQTRHLPSSSWEAETGSTGSAGNAGNAAVNTSEMHRKMFTRNDETSEFLVFIRSQFLPSLHKEKPIRPLLGWYEQVTRHLLTQQVGENCTQIKTPKCSACCSFNIVQVG